MPTLLQTTLTGVQRAVTNCRWKKAKHSRDGAGTQALPWECQRVVLPLAVESVLRQDLFASLAIQTTRGSVSTGISKSSTHLCSVLFLPPVSLAIYQLLFAFSFLLVLRLLPR